MLKSMENKILLYLIKLIICLKIEIFDVFSV